VKSVRETGILTNPHNELLHRETRKASRRKNRIAKAREVEETFNKVTNLKGQLSTAKAHVKDIQKQLKESRQASSSSGALSKSRNVTTKDWSCSSSGRVKKTKTKGKNEESKGKGKQKQVVESDSEVLELSDSGKCFLRPF